MALGISKEARTYAKAHDMDLYSLTVDRRPEGLGCLEVAGPITRERAKELLDLYIRWRKEDKGEVVEDPATPATPDQFARLRELNEKEHEHRLPFTMREPWPEFDCQELVDADDKPVSTLIHSPVTAEYLMESVNTAPALLGRLDELEKENREARELLTVAHDYWDFENLVDDELSGWMILKDRLEAYLAARLEGGTGK